MSELGHVERDWFELGCFVALKLDMACFRK